VQPLEAGPKWIQYHAQVRADDARAYSQTLSRVQGDPLVAGVTGGFSFPFDFPFRFKPSPQTSVAVTNEGSVETPVTVILTGYLRNPVIALEDRQLVLNGTLAEGDTLYVSNAGGRKSVILNGTADRRGMLVSEQSRWFELPPRQRALIKLLAADAGAGASIGVEWRHAYK
jgi:hypothetical protein